MKPALSVLDRERVYLCSRLFSPLLLILHSLSYQGNLLWGLVELRDNIKSSASTKHFAIMYVTRFTLMFVSWAYPHIPFVSKWVPRLSTYNFANCSSHVSLVCFWQLFGIDSSPESEVSRFISIHMWEERGFGLTFTLLQKGRFSTDIIR